MAKHKFEELAVRYHGDCERLALFYILCNNDGLSPLIDYIYDFRTNLLKVNTEDNELCYHFCRGERIMFNLAIHMYNPMLGNPEQYAPTMIRYLDYHNTEIYVNALLIYQGYGLDELI